MAKKPRTKNKKIDSFDTKKGIERFIDDLMEVTPAAKGARALAREKSMGATGGLAKSLDPIIKRMSATDKFSREEASKSSRKIEENHQEIQRQAVSISVLEAKTRDLAAKAERALGMAEEFSKNFQDFKKNIDEQFKKIEDEIQKKDSMWGDMLDAAMGAAALSLTKKGGAVAKKGFDVAKKAVSKLRGGVGGLVAGVTLDLARDSLKESGHERLAGGADVLSSALTGASAGALIGSIIPGLGTAVGGAIGGAVGGATGLIQNWSNIFGKGPQESAAIKSARQEGQAPAPAPALAPATSGGTAATSISRPAAGGMPVDTTGLKGVGETGTTIKAMQILTGKGWTTEQAAGMVGNLQMESGPDMKTNAVGDGGKAYGIAQWHPDRQDRFKQQFKKDIREAGFEEQLEFLDWEIKNVETQAYRALKEARTAREAAIAFDRYYERSSGAHVAQRVANAEAIMKSPSQSGVTPGATDEMGRPLPGSIPDAAPVERGVQPIGTNFGAPNPSAGEARDVSSGYKPPAGAAGMPPNVRLGSGVNISAVDKDLLSRFFSAAAEYGRPVTIESAARDDKKQAELWVRGRILHEPGIYMPAPPKTPQRVTVNGREYDVPGGGRGSAHADGQAIDVPQAPQMAGVLQKYGLSIPFGGSDPVHIQKIGYTPVGGAPMGSMGVPQGQLTQPYVSPTQTAMRGLTSTMGGGRGSTIPTSMGAMATAPGVGPMAGLLSTMAMGGARTMVPQSPAGIMGLVGSLFTTLNNQNRGNNPQFNPDTYRDNRVPSAMPPASILREVFGMDIPTAYRP